MIRVSVLSALIAGGTLSAAPAPRPLHRPLTFEPNRGQAPAQFRWLGQSSSYQVLLDSDGATIAIPEKIAPRAVPVEPAGARPRLPFNHTFVRMKLAGSRPWKDIAGAEPTGGVSNYLRGPDVARAINQVPQYGRIKVANVYEGIDLVFYTNGGDLEYDFAVAPGADPEQIQVVFEGAEQLRIDAASGDLDLRLPGGSQLRQLKPRVYQQVGPKRVEIAGGYRLLEPQRAAFTLARYDRRHPLIIDPRLTISRSVGGSDDDQAMAVAVDDSGNTYFTGATFSLNMTVTDNSSYQHCKAFGFLGFCGQGSNSFVAKVNSDGSIGFVTYLFPGSGNGIAVDSTGVYVTGQFVPPEGDITFFPFDNDNGEMFVSKLSPTGQSGFLVFAGGEGTDFGSAIALDDAHNIWAVGVRDLDLHAGDALVLKLATNGTKLFEGKFASSGEDQALGVAVSGRQPWITGKTCGDGFPTTDGTQPHLSHCAVFVLQLDETGHEKMGLVFGGSDKDDAGVAIVTNGSEDAFVTGTVNSTGFPTTPGALESSSLRDQNPALTGTQGFVAEVSPVVSASGVGRIIRSGLLMGATGTVIPYAIANDNRGGIYVAGSTTSVFFPAAVADTPPGATVQRGFVTKIKADLSQFGYSVILGRALGGVALRAPLPVFPPEAACGQCFTEVYVAGWEDSIFGNHISPTDAFMVKMIEDTPTSFVTSTKMQVNTSSFTVSWSASTSVSGAITFDVFVSDNGGPFTPFQTGTAATSATFTGAPGHTYGFFSVATDAGGNREPMKTRADFVVTIVDVTAPVITPQITGSLGNNGWYRSNVAVNWTISDPESGIATSTGCATTNLTADTAGVTLTCSATNGAGLTASVPVSIKIDRTLPVISGMPAAGCSLWPPNHKLVQVATVTAADALSGLATGTLKVTGVSNESSCDPQIVITPNGAGGLTVQLQADRSGNGNGRIYTLNATAMDNAGNTATATATCMVPHDKGSN